MAKALKAIPQQEFQNVSNSGSHHWAKRIVLKEDLPQ
jgi:hypothetical protein